MGFFKKVFRPVRKIAKKIIPKEVRPFLPYIAAAFGPATAGLSFGSGLGTALAKRALIAGATSAATDEQGDPLRAGILAAAPGAISGGLGQVATKFAPVGDAGTALTFTEKLANIASKGDAAVRNFGPLKTIGAQTAIDQSAKFAEIRQDEIDAYNANLLEQGVQDKTKRRAAIFGIYKNAGYDDDYVNNMLDRYGYESGGRIGFAEGLGIFEDEDILENISRGYKGSKDAMRAMFRKKDKKKDPVVTRTEKGKVVINMPKEDEEEKDIAGGLMAAAQGVEKAFGRGFGEMEPVPMLRFARGGEVEIEEETDDLGIMDLMRDQGIEYGEQASNAQNDEILERLFEEFLDMGFSPEDAAKKAREAFDDMSQKPSEGIMQMASGYKDDIDEMYEQYVFEMEEQGLEPMSFSQFLARERAGMKDGGITFEEYLKGRGKEEKRNTREKLLNDYEEFKRRRKVQEQRQEAKDGGSIAELEKALEEDDIQGLAPFFNLSALELDELLEKLREKKRKAAKQKELDSIYEMGRTGAADGGIMEKDMRGGGFIPEGSKERADDVPARLSKNEFVMTADAVRAAGGGSVNKGAKRMYDMMYGLEGKV